MEKHFFKTRIAPTPSGFLHLGNAYSFLLTSRLAKESGAKLLLRIDDMDRQRMRAEYVADIFDTLDFLHIHWDEGPANIASFEQEWSQLYRMDLYKKALAQLIAMDKVFACTCSRHQQPFCTCASKNLPLDTPDAALRLRTDERTKIICRNAEGSQTEAVLPAEMHNFVLWKKDGFPAYQLSSLVDDVYFNIDLIVRGEDLWHSTLAQLYLAQILGMNSFLNASFLHHKLIMNTDGIKLSKSAGDISIREWRRRGKSLQDLLARLGLANL